MVMSLAGLGTKNDCAGKHQQQFTWFDPTRPEWILHIYKYEYILRMKGSLCQLKCLVLDMVMFTKFVGKHVKLICFKRFHLKRDEAKGTCTCNAFKKSYHFLWHTIYENCSMGVSSFRRAESSILEIPHWFFFAKYSLKLNWVWVECCGNPVLLLLWQNHQWDGRRTFRFEN
jgi:hypothetical protein